MSQLLEAIGRMRAAGRQPAAPAIPPIPLPPIKEPPAPGRKHPRSAMGEAIERFRALDEGFLGDRYKYAKQTYQRSRKAGKGFFRSVGKAAGAFVRGKTQCPPGQKMIWGQCRQIAQRHPVAPGANDPQIKRLVRQRHTPTSERAKQKAPAGWSSVEQP